MITVYSTKTCVFCSHVERFLKAKNIAYKKVMLDDDASLRLEVSTKSMAMTVPVTVRGDWDDFVVGWDIAKLNNLVKGL